MPKINSIEIQGFRSFGAETQKLLFASQVAVVWGPNSQGKTSLAEAFEFLLTGIIVRREMLSSAQDEFADSLRNAHIPNSTQVYVAAEILDTTGSPHLVKRSLKEDYGKKSPCVTVLEIDGNISTEEDLSALGVTLSQPPLAAPVLMQHTLGYLFSAKPQQRSLYFKALLEVTDLDDFRSFVDESTVFLDAPKHPLVRKLETCATVPHLSRDLRPLLDPAPTPPRVRRAFSAAAASLLAGIGQSTPPNDLERFELLSQSLASRRAKTFPLDAFESRPLAEWSPPGQEVWTAVDAFLEQLARVDEETKRLTALFQEVLKIPAVAQATQPLDCPVCETAMALTPARIEAIQTKLNETRAFQTSKTDAENALRQSRNSVDALQKALEAACPRFLTWTTDRREKAGFTNDRIRSLLGDHNEPLIGEWNDRLAQLDHARSSLAQAVSTGRDLTTRAVEDPSALRETSKLRNAFASLSQAKDRVTAALTDYFEAQTPLRDALRTIVDQQSNTQGWQEFLDLAADQQNLQATITDQKARQVVRKELAKALRQIDQAKEQVLDQKFQALSDEVHRWWEILRPGEPTFFAGVRPRAKARRNIDFKAGLSATPDRTDAKIRDVVAVFSHSQMHCLGLAAFIARAVREQTGFLILDDPFLSSDEDHRPHFIHSAVEQLIDSGFQVIILTQDHSSWKDLELRYAHRNIDVFLMTREDPARGTTVNKTSDALAVKLARAQPFIRSNRPEIRKQASEQLRDAAERLCKEILVKNLQAADKPTAALSDYDGKNLGQLIPEVEPFLSDAAHPGKLKTIARSLNPGKHDDRVPSIGELSVAYGDLRSFKKDYL